jgi:ComF family protein
VSLLDLVVPRRCLSCGAGGADLCGSCRRRLRWLHDACPRCALPRPCRRCPGADAPWHAARAAVAYAGPARDLVHALKFGRSRAAADAMAAALAVMLAGHVAAGAGLVAVPPHPRRTRRRGWDHAALLTAAVARRTGGEVHAPLVRAGEARQLEAASAGQRRDPRRLAIAVRGDAPTEIVLVDDVHTTGATLSACTAALLGAGARRVVVATFARTLPDRSSNR